MNRSVLPPRRFEASRFEANPPTTPGRFERWGRGCARRGTTVVAVWLLLVVVAVGADRAWGGSFTDSFELPGTDAQAGADLLADQQAGVRGIAGQLVFHSPQAVLADNRQAIDATVRAVAELPGVVTVSDPFAVPAGAAPGGTAAAPLPATVSADGRTAYVTVRTDAAPTQLGDEFADDLATALTPAEDAGLEVSLGGPFAQLERDRGGHLSSEATGLAVALVVLLLAFGSVLAAVTPLLTGLFAVVGGLGLLGLVAALTTVPSSSPTLATMMGLGVGIDYALFLVARHRDQLAAGEDVVDSIGRTVATSGRAVVVAAGTVVVSIFGLYASGVAFLGALGIGAAITVTVAAAAALTLVPAILGLAGRRLTPSSPRGSASTGTGTAASTGTAAAAGPGTRWDGYAALVGRRAPLFGFAGLLTLGLLAVPAASMRLAHIDAGSDPVGSSARTAYDRISAGFGEGANGPLTLVVDLGADPAVLAPDATAALAAELAAALAADPGVAAASPALVVPQTDLMVVQVVPTTGPSEPTTAATRDRLADEVLPAVLAESASTTPATGSVSGTSSVGTGSVSGTGYVTGVTAAQLEFRDTLAERLPVVMAVVASLAFLILLTVFRGLLVALKAAVLNLASVAAAYGVVVAVFQWGWGVSLLGLAGPVPIETFVPTMMFAITFGLSMDYEVFLLSRIREAWLETGDNQASVAQGLAATARVITAAGLIMTGVFLAFALSSVVVVKMLAVGLAVSVVVDATIVRLVLVPASMTLLGKANWWLPNWLDRRLPHLE